MKKRRRDSKPRDLERRLVTYVVTAGAALVAGAHDASASPITRTVNLDIPPSNTSLTYLDVNNDGINDFFFGNLSSLPDGVLFGGGYLPPSTKFGTSAFDTNNALFGLPKASSKGVTEGVGIPLPKGSFQWGPNGLTYGNSGFSPSKLVTDGFLGFAGSSAGGLLTPYKFNLPTSFYYPLPLRFDDASNNTYYGWARIRAQFAGSGTLSASILDVGWESQPDTPIHIPDPAPVPEPGTLGLLALGALGVAIKRRMGGRTPAE